MGCAKDMGAANSLELGEISCSHWGIHTLDVPWGAVDAAYLGGFQDGYNRAAYDYQVEPNN